MLPSCSFTWPSLPALATVCILHRGCPNCDAPPKPLELLSATCAARISLGQSYKKTSAYTLPYLYCSWLCTAITEYGRVRPCLTLALDGADSQLWVILAERAETSLVSHIVVVMFEIKQSLGMQYQGRTSLSWPKNKWTVSDSIRGYPFFPTCGTFCWFPENDQVELIRNGDGMSHHFLRMSESPRWPPGRLVQDGLPQWIECRMENLRSRVRLEEHFELSITDNPWISDSRLHRMTCVRTRTQS